MFKVAEQMITPMRLQHRVAKDVMGAPEFDYIDADDPIIYCNFKSRGGTEAVHNGRYVVIDTATIQTWYRPDIKKSDRLILDDGSMWEIKGKENVEQRNQILILKVQSAGGA